MILISDFWHQIKMYNFDPYNVLLVIATNIPQQDSYMCRRLSLNEVNNTVLI